MAYTQADLDAIRAKITEARRVQFADGRSVENHALVDLLEAESRIANAVAAAAPTARPRRRTVAYRNGC